MIFPVLCGGEQVHLECSQPLEDDTDDLWVERPLVARGEGSAEAIHQNVQLLREMQCLSVNRMLHAEIPQTEGSGQRTMERAPPYLLT